MRKPLIFVADSSLLKIKIVSAAQGAAVTYASLSHLKDPYVFSELSRQLRSGETKTLILPEKVSVVGSSVFETSLNSKSNSDGVFSFYTVDDVAAAGEASRVVYRDCLEELSLSLSKETGVSQKDCFNFLTKHPEVVRAKVSYFLSSSEKEFESNEVPSHLVSTQLSNDSQFRLAEGIDLLSGAYLYSLKFVPKEARPTYVSQDSDAVLVNVEKGKLDGVDAKNSQFVSDTEAFSFAKKLSNKLHDLLAINTSMYYSHAKLENRQVSKGSAVELLHKGGLKTPVLEVTNIDVPFSDSAVKREFNSGVLVHCSKEIESGYVHFDNILNYVKRSNPLVNSTLQEHHDPKYISKTSLKDAFSKYSKSKLSSTESNSSLKPKGNIGDGGDSVD